MGGSGAPGSGVLGITAGVAGFCVAGFAGCSAATTLFVSPGADGPPLQPAASEPTANVPSTLRHAFIFIGLLFLPDWRAAGLRAPRPAPMRPRVWPGVGLLPDGR